MNCKHSENDLALYVGGDLPEAKAKEVENHVLECTGCRHALEELSRSQAVFKSVRQETVSAAELAELRARVMERVAVQKPKLLLGRRVYALAGAALVVVIMAGVLVRGGHRDKKAVKVVELAPPPPTVQTVFPSAKVESQNPVKVNVKHRARKKVIQPRVSAEPAAPMMVKLQTDDPNIVIYWLFDQNGDSL